MDRLNIRVSKKIRLIQGQNVGYAISSHYRGRPRIMHLNTVHIICDYQLAPDRINRLVVGQKGHCAFDVFDAPVGFRNREAVAISLGRPSADVPEFSDVLRGKAKFRSLFEQPLNTCSDKFMLGIVLL
jgi:hypothetical protein